MKGSSTSPPPFGWDDWYASIGGRSIHITEIDSIFHEIKEYQYPKFKGEVNPIQTVFKSSQAAAALVKTKAFELGADEAGIADTGKITDVKFTINDVARTFKKDQRIMVQIQSSWFPLVDRNPQKMVDIYTCSDKDFQKATIIIYHDEANTSYLVLPVLH
jgi:hypothetical protein